MQQLGQRSHRQAVGKGSSKALHSTEGVLTSLGQARDHQDYRRREPSLVSVQRPQEASHNERVEIP